MLEQKKNYENHETDIKNQYKQKELALLQKEEQLVKKYDANSFSKILDAA